ncbi:MAG TPA: hypothetical protein V6C90_22150 [Coleofasciculaceae cyanobacterium]
MEYWEFLLQKEGDRSWLPIKSQRLEIEAGRYRVVAHSSRTNTDVEICVTHESTKEVPPRRRSQKRSRRTNPEGLMVVIPFTFLKPGRWEIRCCGDIMSDFLGNSWQQAIQIEVLPQATAVSPTDESASPAMDAIPTSDQAELSEKFPHISDREGAKDSILETRENEQTSPVSGQKPLDLSLKETIKNCPEDAELVPEKPPYSNPPDASEEYPSPQPLVPSASESDIEPTPIETQPTPLTPLADTSEVPDPEIAVEIDTNFDEVQAVASTLAETAAAVPESETLVEGETNLDEVPVEAATLADTEVPFEPAELDENLVALTSNSAEVATPTNPILDQSLQMLEQILQQVLEPVLQEFEQSEPQNPQVLLTPELELPSETDSNQPGLILTLDEEALVARRGESLTITGQVDVLDVNPLSDSKTASALNSVFQGTLRYELRDPQSSQVLVDAQHPLSEQALPLAFSHTLEIPPDCKTRLILGKVTLYGSTSVPLASQPFSVTADLDELLGAIIPASKVMPVAKMLVLANNLAASQEIEADLSASNSPPLNQAVLDLLDVLQNPQPLSLQPVSQQPLPPQIYQPSPNHKASKSLQLPKLPKMRPITAVDSSEAVSGSDGGEVKQEDFLEQPIAIAPADELSPDIPNQQPEDKAEDTALELQSQEAVQELEDATLQEDTVLAADSSSNALDAIALSDIPVPIADSGLGISDALETPESSESTADSYLDTSEAIDTLTAVTPTADSRLSDSEAIDALATVTPAADSSFNDLDMSEWLDDPELEIESAEVQHPEPVANEPTVDNAFQALKVQDRFWVRLNSLAVDAELSQWLKSELSPSSNLVDEVEDTQELEPEPVVIEVEDVTQQLNSDKLLADFDESIWAEETDEFGSTADETTELQSPLPSEDTSLQVETPEELPLEKLAITDWAAQEFVVDDDDLVVPEQSVVKPNASRWVNSPGQLTSQPESKIFSPPQLELPLPAPVLFVPTSELAAGEPVTVRVKLPPHPARLCIKLWVQDRQSRSLLDGPRWLVDLLPDGAGQLEAMTQLIVPFGSVEVRLEAIAIDIDSQRESHKVSVDCVVVPPDLPNISLDEFET